MDNILELLYAFQGIIGVLAGMFGSQLLRNIGKTFIFVQNSSFKYIAKESDGAGGFIEREIKSLTDGPNHCTYSMDLEIYNSSEMPRILRNIQIQFYKDKKLIGVSIPNNDSTRRRYAGGIISDEIRIINIHAKEIVRFNISGNIHLDGCYDKVYFTAIQNKSRKLKKLIVN